MIPFTRAVLVGVLVIVAVGDTNADVQVCDFPLYDSKKTSLDEKGKQGLESLGMCKFFISITVKHSHSHDHCMKGNIL